MLVRRRIQTPSATGIGARFAEGEVVLGAPPPARRASACHAGRASSSLSQAAVDRRLRRRRVASRRPARQRERRVPQAQAGDLLQALREPLEPPVALSARTASSCSCAARLVRTRFAWSAFASRFASRPRRGDDGALLERERGVAGAGGGEDRPIASSALRVGDGMPAASSDAERELRRRPRPPRGTRAPSSEAVRSSRCGERGPESEPAPSSAPRR